MSSTCDDFTLPDYRVDRWLDGSVESIKKNMKKNFANYIKLKLIAIVDPVWKKYCFADRKAFVAYHISFAKINL